MSEHRLTQEIIARSTTETWDEAKLEWALDNIYYNEEPETCLCGHFPITEICILVNRKSGHTAIVGNYCVKKFIGLPSDKIFQAVRRVRQDYKKPLNEETINHAYKHRWITDWEYSFYLHTRRKRNMTQRQIKTRIQINQKIIAQIDAARPQSP